MSARRKMKTLTVYYGPPYSGKSTMALRTGALCFSVRHWLEPLQSSRMPPMIAPLLDDTKVFAAIRSFLKEHEAAEHIVFDDFPGTAAQLDWVMKELSQERQINFCYVHVDWKTAMQRALARRDCVQYDDEADSIVPTTDDCYSVYGDTSDYRPDDTEKHFQKRWQSYFVHMRKMYQQDRYGLFRTAVDVAHMSLLKKGLRMDLHLHTTASDGTNSPAEMMDRVAAAGIELCAVTDHDTVSGLAEAKEYALRLGIALLLGIEISALWQGHLVHLLGYGIDPENTQLQSVIERNRKARQEYDERVLCKLESREMLPLGSRDKYARYEWNRRRGGWKLLNFLTEVGLCRDGFDYLHLIEELDVGRILYLPAEEAIEAIRDSGLCVLAHPGAYGWQIDTLPVQLEGLRKAGIDGLECLHPQNGSILTDYLRDYCACWGLLSTGGSDEHGNLPDRALGMPYADTLLLGTHPVIHKIIWPDIYCLGD